MSESVVTVITMYSYFHTDDTMIIMYLCIFCVISSPVQAQQTCEDLEEGCKIGERILYRPYTILLQQNPILLYARYKVSSFSNASTNVNRSVNSPRLRTTCVRYDIYF